MRLKRVKKRTELDSKNYLSGAWKEKNNEKAGHISRL